ncbi:tRNA (adenosine(37)-N6)-threonylcarbamoyltransferase complex ATPase subunit type 1 TsaE [Alteromonas sp. 14N.309.X.WAT.G.H12]|uniref:tRNA (adenosine(37)-N6)-threonylcarbamoyltransferase complex ATPase subunit type 1 TsaE n=1 Tax=Alteromonas sp. 14N.309.X.WAT.G.H12 TaxID=3120824 RepID=UPI002FD007A5
MSDHTLIYDTPELEETQSVAVKLAQVCEKALPAGIVIYLKGDLGAGKTTFSRYFIQQLGHQGKVKSPTYTLVEPYELDGVTVFHFDLYRLADPEELEFMGIRDYFAESTICLVEWPQKGAEYLAAADLVISINVHDNSRKIMIAAKTPKGAGVLTQLSTSMGT